jgi:uncharacterized DUF497 family protein
MKVEYDPAKSARNEQQRGIPFSLAAQFDGLGAVYSEDVRHDYQERRYVALGYLDERLHMLCFTIIDGGVRVISFRKASQREVKRYEQAIRIDPAAH